jgi:predicted amidohydrolase YtcJ
MWYGIRSLQPRAEVLVVCVSIIFSCISLRSHCAAAAQAVKDGRIAAVGQGLVDAGMTAKELYDASGQHVAPGWIDPHTHFVRSPACYVVTDHCGTSHV